MSRVGKMPVTFAAPINVDIVGQLLTASSANKKVDYQVPDLVSVEKTANSVIFQPKNTSKTARSLWGTTQRNFANIIKGFSEGFKLNIELVGVGYKASVSGQKLKLSLGYSHDIDYDIPEGIKIECTKPTAIVITGASKQKVGMVGAYLKSLRKPEPYKGKGVIRENDFILRKEGKKK